MLSAELLKKELKVGYVVKDWENDYAIVKEIKESQIILQYLTFKDEFMVRRIANGRNVSFILNDRILKEICPKFKKEDLVALLL